MLRVLHVLGSLQRGGAETFVMNVYRRIDRSIIQFDFLVKERVANGYESEALALGARIFEVPSAKQLGAVKYIQEQRRVILENGPFAAVHSHVNYLSGMTLLAAKLAGVRCRIAHSHSTRFPQGIGEKISRFAIIPFSTKLFACSQDAGKALFGDANFEVIGNGVEWEKYVSCPVDTAADSPFTIVQIGRFVEVKNHRFTLQVLKKLSDVSSVDFRVVFLGDGPLLDDTKKQINECGLRDKVSCPGSVSNPEAWLRAADCVIMPSLYEGIPLSAIEAQCASCSLIVSDRVSPLIDLGLGLCHFLPLESSKWVEALLHLMGADRHRFSLEAIEKAVIEKGFAPEQAADKLSDYYESLDSVE